MRGFRALQALAALALIGAAPARIPIGTSFQRLEQGRVVQAPLPADAQKIAIYHGAGWCGPCRAFVPEVIAAYPELRARGIEVLFVSDDATCVAALDYARTSRMPWLLLPCDPQRRARLRASGGKALPGIVIVDRNGAQIRTSWSSNGSSEPRRTLRTVLE
jgi:thiol-disulfide isomerase/thioredoxin